MRWPRCRWSEHQPASNIAEGEMPRKANNKLDNIAVEAAQPMAKQYRLCDGGGLMLLVTTAGAKVWTCRLMVGGKRREMGLGSYPAVSLDDARQKADDARRKASRGLDPIAIRGGGGVVAIAAPPPWKKRADQVVPAMLPQAAHVDCGSLARQIRDDLMTAHDALSRAFRAIAEHYPEVIRIDEARDAAIEAQEQRAA